MGIKKLINHMMSLFYFLGLWHRDDEPTVRETMVKLFFSIYYFLFPMSVMGGGILTDDKNESVFLVEISIISAVMSVKVLYIIWKKDAIYKILNQCGVFTVEDNEDFKLVNDTLDTFEKIIETIFAIVVVAALFITVIFPCLVGKPLFNIAFPLDWKRNKFAYWLVNTFLFTEVFLYIITLMFSVIIWYLLLTCTLKYQILGNRMRNLGTQTTSEATGNSSRISVTEKKLFTRNLIAAVISYHQIREYNKHSGQYLLVGVLIIVFL